MVEGLSNWKTWILIMSTKISFLNKRIGKWIFLTKNLVQSNIQLVFLSCHLNICCWIKIHKTSLLFWNEEIESLRKFHHKIMIWRIKTIKWWLNYLRKKHPAFFDNTLLWISSILIHEISRFVKFDLNSPMCFNRILHQLVTI